MGCASSKPSSKSKKSKNNKQQTDSNNNNVKTSTSGGKSGPGGNNNQQTSTALNVNGLDPKATSPLHLKQQQQAEKLKKLNQPIGLDQSLVNEIDKNRQQVIDHLVSLVHKQLNAELIANGSKHLAEVVLAASSAHDNDDLITDVVSRAVLLLLSGQLPAGATYKDLFDNLKSHTYMCKHQTHKTRICELTVETIHSCLDSIHEELKKSGDRFSLVEFLNNNLNDPSNSNSISNDINVNSNLITPPNSPEDALLEQQQNKQLKQNPSLGADSDWKDAVLLSRAQAKEVARLLFLSDRARPVVHASPKAKDAYFVNKQLSDNSEITVSQQEIDEILNLFDKPELIEIKDDHFYIAEQHSTPSTHHNHHHNQETPESLAHNTPLAHVHLQRDLEDNFIAPKPINLIDKFNSLVEAESERLERTHEQYPSLQLNTTIENDLTTVTIDNQTNNVTIEYETDIAKLDSANALEPEITHEKVDTFGTVDEALATIAATSSILGRLQSLSHDNEPVQEPQQPNVVQDNANNLQEQQEAEPSITVIQTQTTTITTTTVTTSDPYEDANKNGHLDPILKQSLLDDRFYNNSSFKTEAPVNGENENEAATRIQSNYKGHVERSDVDNTTEEAQAEPTPASPAVEDKQEELRPESQPVEEPQQQIEPEPAATEDPDEEKLKEEAATRIQATFRGYKTRKSFNNKSKANPAAEEESPSQPDAPEIQTQDQTEPEAAAGEEEPVLADDETPTEPNVEKSLDEAATKIQATFRGFKTRKELKKDTNKLNSNNSTDHDANIQTDYVDEIKKVHVDEVKFENDVDNNNGGFQIELSNLIKTAASLPSLNTSINNNPNSNNTNNTASNKEQKQQDDELVEDYINNSNDHNSHSIVGTTVCSMDSNKQSNKSKLVEKTKTKHHFNTANSSNSSSNLLNTSIDLLNKAATKIQSTFRGYKTRKHIGKQHKSSQDINMGSSHSLGNKSRPYSASTGRVNLTVNNSNPAGTTSASSLLTSSTSPLNDAELAAIKIQSTFRGYKTRKQLKLQKQPSHQSQQPTMTRSLNNVTNMQQTDYRKADTHQTKLK